MKHEPRIERDKLTTTLADDIKAYLSAGGKVKEVPRGASVKVDMTNGWKQGFCINDNVGFGKKRPRNKK
jgi:hypothetical protein